MSSYTNSAAHLYKGDPTPEQGSLFKVEEVKINYCFYTVRTTYGVLVIKIWILIHQE